MVTRVGLQLGILLACASGHATDPDPAGAAFEAALAAESHGRQEAAKLYRDLLARHPGSRYASEALLRLAVMEDERQHDPGAALALYREYLKSYPDGRLTLRAETRIKALAPYEEVDPEVYRQYLAILANPDVAMAQGQMAELIHHHPDYPRLDDALFWLANQMKGFKSKADNPADLAGAGRAIPLYERLLRDYPSSPLRSIAIKNLGDAYLVVGDYSRALHYYRAVEAQWGRTGELMVGEVAKAAAIKLWRRRLLYASLAVIPFALIALLWVLPLRRRWLREAARAGFRHALYVLPLAMALAISARALTSPGRGDHRGGEPWLMTACGLALLVFCFLNGAAMRIDQRERVHGGVYLPALLLLIVASMYCALYGFDMLPYFERMFV